MSPERTERARRLKEAIRRKKSRPEAGSSPAGLKPRPQGRPARASELQESLWLAQQLDPESAAYNMVSAFRLASGGIDRARVSESFASVVRRHRILRSTFHRDADAIVQKVDDEPRAELEVLDLPESAAEGAEECLRREARRPFDLERGPLTRLLWVEAADGVVLLALVAHHIVADERSLEIFWRDLESAYRGDSLPEPALQYDDWAHTERERRSEDAAAVDFWRQRLGVPEEAEWQMQRRSPGERGGDFRQLALDPRVGEGLRTLAATTGTTPFVVHLLAFALQLRSISRTPCAFATPLSLRRQAATAEMVGYFLNPVVVPLELEASLTVEQAIARGHALLQELRPQADLPFARLLDRLAWPRSSARHPLFQTFFVYQELGRAPKLGTAQLDPLFVNLGESKFELTLFATDSGPGGPSLAVEFDTRRFAKEEIDLLLERHAALLHALALSPRDRPVVSLDVLTEQERLWLDERSTVAARSEQIEGPLLPERIAAQVRDDAEAVVCGDERLSWPELAATAQGVAHELVRRGIGPGDRVGLQVPRSTHLVAGLVGILWSGAAYVPIDPSYPASRNRRLAEPAGLRALVVGGDVEPVCDAPLVRVGSKAAGHAAPVAVASGDPVYVLFTSGSSGQPKGVVVDHGNLRASTLARPVVYGSDPGRFLLLSSVAFDSSVAGLFWTLGSGGTLVLPTDREVRDARRLAELCDRERIQTLLTVPSLWAQMLERGEFSTLETAIVAGEACSRELVDRHAERLPEARLFNEYGPTEATVWATAQRLSPAPAGTPAIGRPVPGASVRVLDRLGRELPPGFEGIGWILGPTVTRGYLDRPAETQERFRSWCGEPAYCTGDRLRWNETGDLLFLGRDDEQLKVRGQRIEPGEIESLVLAQPGVHEVAVVLAPQSERLVGFVVTEGRTDALRQTLREALPEAMVPQLFLALDELPRLPNGKVDRRQLSERAAESSRLALSVALETDLQRTLANLWEGLLGLPSSSISLDSNFFEAGGHSLLVVEMCEAIERDLGVSLEAADVFEHPTIRQLAERVESRGGGTSFYDHLFALQPIGAADPFVMAIPHFFSETLNQAFRGRRPVYGLRGVGIRAEGNRGRWPTMEALGRELTHEVVQRFGERPLYVGGYSFGASMAFELARQLRERGVPVRGLLLIAPMPLDLVDVGPLRLSLPNLGQPVGELSARERRRRALAAYAPTSAGFYREVRRRFVTVPGRRLLCAYGDLRRAVGAAPTPWALHADVRLERFRLHRDYRPATVDCPVIVFNPEGESTDAAATWAPHFTGPVELCPTPDPHHGEAEVEETKRRLFDRLRALE
ncbi:MAG: amino acid adenylation domain-containing protein [Acidobacteriota bacterium]